MGYPMTWQRLWERNNLDWSGRGWPYAQTKNVPCQQLIGDLRRFVNDAQDENHIALYARAAGITEAQARNVITTLFDGEHGTNLSGTWHEPTDSLDDLPPLKLAPSPEGSRVVVSAQVPPDWNYIANQETIDQVFTQMPEEE